LLTSTAPTYIYTLSLHDALPIFPSNGTQCFTDAPSYSRTLSISSKLFLEFIPKLWGRVRLCFGELCAIETASEHPVHLSVQFILDRKSTRLNSSHEWISYAVFCF